MKASLTFRNFFTMIFLYWRSKDPSVKTSALYFILSIALVFVAVAANVSMVKISGAMMDSIQNYDLPKFLHIVLILVILYVVFSILSAYQGYFFSLMQIRWRNWLTSHLTNRWLISKAYYQIETFGSTIDNPDQRISDDIGSLIYIFSNLFLGLVGATLTLSSFAVVLWQLSTPVNVPIGHGHYFILQGDMFWAALVYSLFTTYVTFKIGRPLIRLNFMQQRFEAFFRFNLMRIRENSEQIALYQAEPYEKKSLQTKFDDIINNFIAIAKRQRLLNLFTTMIGYLVSLVPTLLALPGYFARKYQIGGITQVLQAFGSVSDSLSYFIINYTQLASILATAERLQLLTYESEKASKPWSLPYTKLKTIYSKDTMIQLKDLTLYKPQGEVLIAALNEQFKKGEHTLVMGPSGIGKSTLLRAISGIWPFATGTITKPNNKIWFIPQKPYLAQGSIRELMAFPDPTLYDEKKIQAALEAVGLGKLFDSHLSTNWNNTLSLGEQQRLALARVLIHQPDWLLLDEATSSLDEDSETMLYQLLQKQLPDMTIISVGHRSRLKELHCKVIFLKLE